MKANHTFREHLPLPTASPRLTIPTTRPAHSCAGRPYPCTSQPAQPSPCGGPCSAGRPSVRASPTAYHPSSQGPRAREGAEGGSLGICPEPDCTQPAHFTSKIFSPFPSTPPSEPPSSGLEACVSLLPRPHNPFPLRPCTHSPTASRLTSWRSSRHPLSASNPSLPLEAGSFRAGYRTLLFCARATWRTTNPSHRPWHCGPDD